MARPEHNAAEVTLLVGDVGGRDAILIDDMIDTAGTLVAGARVIRRAGARRILAAAVHGLFSGPAFERLQASDIQEVVVTDTVPLPPHAPRDLIRVVSVARLLADSVHNVFCDESVSEIFAGENQLF
ncbi:MAG TPA: ribose-phosphate diphosphokinase [Miltoncostaeaceae bacterium]|nr:ribose-phosphate diphosphokinase [Miltoncostaeaceae bacterium]